MKVYQESNGSVKGENGVNLSKCVNVLDTEALKELLYDGLLNLSVVLGLHVMGDLLESDATELAGEKGKHRAERTAYRHGTGKSSIVLGGEKVTVERPRVRAIDGGELALPTLAILQDEDPLNRAILARLLSGVSTRKCVRTLDIAVENSSCTSKSEVSRRFIAGMDVVMKEFFERRIEGSYPVIQIDGLGLGDMTVLAAMGIDDKGNKRILGIKEGGTENSELCKVLFADLTARGLDPCEPRLYVIDGAKALHKAIKDTFGKSAVIQRCQVHKKRNVLSHLPESEQENISLALTMAYREFDYAAAKSKLELLADNLEHRYPSAANSLREGLEETLTVHRLKISGLLRKTLSSTNAMESANSVCVGVLRRVSHFKDGKMTLRHAAAGFLEAERSFHRIRGYKDMHTLIHQLKLLTDSGDWAILESA